MIRKGIILAGGNGTRLFPSSATISKHLLPIYDKPMIYYSLSALMLANIREVMIICNGRDIQVYEELFKHTLKLGINFSFAEQPEPLGVANALVVAKKFIGNDYCCLILGDNFFYGHNLSQTLKEISGSEENRIIGYPVQNPSNFGVVEFDKDQNILAMSEKPSNPISRYAITGLYFLDHTAPERAMMTTKSNRNEYEIVDVLKSYHAEGDLGLELLGRGDAWLDAGCHESLIDASLFVRSVEKRQGLKIGCPEEIAWRKGWITTDALIKSAELYNKSSYSQYLMSLPSDKIVGNIK